MNPFSLLLVLAVAVTPLYPLRLTVIGVPFYLPELFISAAAVAWLVSWLTQRLRPVSLPVRVVLPLLIFLIGALIATYQGGSESYGGLKSWVIFPLIFGYLSVQALAASTQARRNFEAGLFISALIVSLWGIAEVVMSGGRLSSFFNSPNAAAMWLVPVLFVLLPSYRKSRLDQLGLVVILIGVVLTQSFGGYLALGSGLLAWLIFSRAGAMFAIISSTVALVLFSYLSLTKYLALAVTPLFGERLGGRLQIWAMGRDAIDSFGWLGFGPGRFESFYLSKVGMTFANPIEWNVPQPHNFYLATWLSSGLIGLVGMLSLLVVLINDQLRNKQFFLLAAVVAVVVHGLVDTTYWKNDLAIIFFLIVAMSVQPDRSLSTKSGA